MDGKNFPLISELEKLSQDKTVSNSAKKDAANRLNQVTFTVRKFKLLPTHKQFTIFYFSA